LIDPDAVLTLTLTPERFQPIPRRYPQRVERGGGIQPQQLEPRLSLEGLETAHRTIVEQGLGVLVSERPDHATDYYESRITSNVIP
jgi:hypothetical protein